MVSLLILIGSLVASFLFAVCAFACYKVPFDRFLPGISAQRFRRIAKMTSAAGFFGLSMISLAIFLEILFGDADFH